MKPTLRLASALCLVLLAGDMLSGCAGRLPNTSALSADASTQQKKIAAEQDLIFNLSDPGFQAGAEAFLTGASIIAVSAVPTSDQPDIRSLMTFAGTLAVQTANLQSFSVSDIQSVMDQIGVKFNASKYQGAIAAYQGFWAQYLPKIKSIGSVELARTWLLIFGRAALAGGV